MIEIDGMKEVFNTLALLDRAAQEQVMEYMDKRTDEILAEAQRNVPVDEGDLLRALEKRKSAGGLTIDVGTYEDPEEAHATFVEFPTEDTQSQPFLFPAYLKGIRLLRRDIRGMLKDTKFRLRTRTKRHAKTRTPKP